MDDELYTAEVLDEVDSPYHRGQLANPTISHEMDARPNCSDTVRMDLLLNAERRVTEAWFSGEGCVFSQAAASMLTREIEGKSLDELRNLEPAQVLDLLGVRLTPARQKCALLCFKVL